MNYNYMRNATPMSILSEKEYYNCKNNASVVAGFGQYAYDRKTFHSGVVIWLYFENGKEVNEPGLVEKLETEYQKLKKILA
jgi:hypothetical protein